MKSHGTFLLACLSAHSLNCNFWKERTEKLVTKGPKALKDPRELSEIKER